jgi:hypothetical protein
VTAANSEVASGIEPCRTAGSLPNGA